MWVASRTASDIAAPLSQQIGVDASILKVALLCSDYGPKPLGDDVTAAEQRVADSLFALKLLPAAIKVRDVATTLPP